MVTMKSLLTFTKVLLSRETWRANPSVDIRDQNSLQFKDYNFS
uniref:Uncharacterized protein n=1 Tax=Anguilla anguilla TaxID=7936 RepID=A0A0E9SZ61_ANGAN